MQTQYRWLLVARAFGILLMLAGPGFALLFTVHGLTSAFQSLGDSGIGDPTTLSGAIREVLGTNLVGLLSFPAGLIIFLVAYVKMRRIRYLVPPPIPPHGQQLG